MPSSKCPTQSRRIDFGRLASRALAEATQREVKAMHEKSDEKRSRGKEDEEEKGQEERG